MHETNTGKTVQMAPCNNRSSRTSSTRDIVDQFVGYWSAQDVVSTSALFSSDAYSEVHLGHAEVGMSGPILGREAITAGLYQNLAQWHYIVFDATVVAIEGDTGRVQVNFEYEHIATGLRLNGTMRMVIVVTDGQISRVDCFHDTERVSAFMRMLRAQEAEQDRMR